MHAFPLSLSLLSWVQQASCSGRVSRHYRITSTVAGWRGDSKHKLFAELIFDNLISSLTTNVRTEEPTAPFLAVG